MSELKDEFKTMRRIEDTKVGGGKRFGSLDQSLRDLSSSPGSVDEKKLMTIIPRLFNLDYCLRFIKR